MGKIKKYLIIFFIGIFITAFSNIFSKNHNEILVFIFLSVLSFVAANIMKNINIGYVMNKVLLFIFFPFVIFFIIDFKYGFKFSSVLYHLLYLFIIILFFFLGNYVNFKKNNKQNLLILSVSILLLISEIYFVPEIIYSNNIIKEDNKEIPDFTLKDLNGNTITKENFKGKVVFFDFWTTTCGYCIAQFPSIYKVAENFKDNPDVLFYLIDYNGKFDDTEYVKKFMKQRNIRLPVLIDKSSELSKKMNCLTFPHSFILDKNLKIRYHHVGYQKAIEDVYIKDVTNRIKELLNE